MREIVLDTETTGLDPLTGDRLVEIGCVEMVNRVEVLDPPHAIAWEPGQDAEGDGNLQFGGWIWRYDLAPAGPGGTEVTLTYDWSTVPAHIREYIQFPPFPVEHLTNSLHHLAERDVRLVWSVDEQIAHVGLAAPGGRHALHDDVEDRLVLEDAAHLDALQQGGLGAPNRTGGDAERLRLGQIDLDLDRRGHRILGLVAARRSRRFGRDHLLADRRGDLLPGDERTGIGRGRRGGTGALGRGRRSRDVAAVRLGAASLEGQRRSADQRQAP